MGPVDKIVLDLVCFRLVSVYGMCVCVCSSAACHFNSHVEYELNMSSTHQFSVEGEKSSNARTLLLSSRAEAYRQHVCPKHKVYIFAVVMLFRPLQLEYKNATNRAAYWALSQCGNERPSRNSIILTCRVGWFIVYTQHSMFNTWAIGCTPTACSSVLFAWVASAKRVNRKREVARRIWIVVNNKENTFAHLAQLYRIRLQQQQPQHQQRAAREKQNSHTQSAQR